MQDKNAHILSTSSDLLGLCLVVVSVMHSTKASDASKIDKFAGIAALFFMASCFLSFLSMRSKNLKRSHKYESLADGVFIIGLFVFVGVIVLASFDIIA